LAAFVDLRIRLDERRTFATGDRMRPPLDKLAVPTLLAISFTLEAVHPHLWPPLAHLPESPVGFAYVPPSFAVSSNSNGGTPAAATAVVVSWSGNDDTAP
jgi:hypothetical protein